jgi:NodT family efflux transporter outer membrane factor (OMF) lipoprotein
MAAAMWLASCTLGPHYVAPPPPPGARSLVAIDESAETRAAPPDAWWRLYKDSTLDGLLEQAFRANYDLKAADANVLAARALFEGARAARYPATDLSASAVRGRNVDLDLILEVDGYKPFNIWLYDALFDLSYEVDVFGRVRRLIEAAEANAEAVQAARDGLKVTIAAETTRAYGEICALGEELSVAERNLALVSREAQITVARRAAGAGSDFDVVRAQALVSDVQARIPPLRGQRRAALFELAALTGRTPGAAPAAALECTAAPKLASLVPVGDGAELLRRRPDVREAERLLAAATAQIGVATAELFPRITLIGSFGTIGDEVNQLGTSVGGTWGIGPSISWQFPNLAGPLAAVHRAKANAAAALAGFDAVVLQALKETEQALSIYGAELEHHRDLVEAQARAQRAFDLARDQFAAGAISDLDLLVAEQTLVTAQEEVAQSDAALVEDQIAIFKALGGGWAGSAN